MFLSRAESSYLHQHLSVVRHVTLDPEGPGVLRIHLLPCKKARRNVPFVALLNGQDILPVSYTHLDVYKRQVWCAPAALPPIRWPPAAMPAPPRWGMRWTRC